MFWRHKPSNQRNTLSTSCNTTNYPFVIYTFIPALIVMQESLKHLKYE